jgi:hypothetical protein
MVGIRKIETTTYLTADMGSAIADVAAAWSSLELELEHTIKQLGRMPHKTARVLVTGMNARTRLGCVEGLLQLRPATSGALVEEFTKIKTEIEQGAEGDRNKVVHGIWHRTPKDGYFLVRTSGAWAPPGKKGKFKRSVHAELEPIDSPKIRAIQWRINDLLMRLRAWRGKL